MGNRALAHLVESGALQTKLSASQPGDAFEREADSTAARVVTDSPKQSTSTTSSPPRVAYRNAQPASSPAGAVADSALSGLGAGRALDGGTRTVLEPGFDHDFSDVRVHTGAAAHALAKSIGSRAFTVGRDIVFADHEYAPHTSRGRHLLAHELTHVKQQVGARHNGATPPAVQRAPDDDSATQYDDIRMHYNGDTLIVSGERNGQTEEVFRFEAHSGKPLLVDPAVAKMCGGDVAKDSYLDDKKYVGVKDHGPIPEGRYRLRAPGIMRFDLGEQVDLLKAKIGGKKNITIRGTSVGTGDWGSGRVFLDPIRPLAEGPCGSTAEREEFFLHGGILAGSAGCIDILGEFATLAEFLKGYTRPIIVSVKYENSAPGVRALRGFASAVGYGFKFDLRHGPGVHVGSEFWKTPEGEQAVRGLLSPGYGGSVNWAGGSLDVGASLDILAGKEGAALRGGVSAGTDFRLFGRFSGRAFGGLSVPLVGPDTEPGPGWTAGGGLRIDAESALIDVLYGASQDFEKQAELRHRVMLGLTIPFGREGFGPPTDTMKKKKKKRP
jgi:hypothetical protein